MQDDTRICFCMDAGLECLHIKWLVGEHFLRLGANEKYSIHVRFGQLFTDKGEKIFLVFKIGQVRLPVPFGD